MYKKYMLVCELSAWNERRKKHVQLNFPFSSFPFYPVLGGAGGSVTMKILLLLCNVFTFVFELEFSA